MAPESIAPDEGEQGIGGQLQKLAENVQESLMAEKEDLNELAIGLPSSVSSLLSNESRALNEDLLSFGSSHLFYSNNILESVEVPKSNQSLTQPILPPPPASETYSDIENVKKELNLITPESISLVTKVNSGQYDLNTTQIVNNLESIKTTFDSSVGGVEEDDRVSDTSDQLNLLSYTDLMIDIFKANTCSEGNCIPIDKNDTTIQS